MNWKDMKFVKQVLGSILIGEKSVINQHSQDYPWKFKQCHGKLA
jgi:hypothetical protein